MFHGDIRQADRAESELPIPVVSMHLKGSDHLRISTGGTLGRDLIDV